MKAWMLQIGLISRVNLLTDSFVGSRRQREQCERDMPSNQKYRPHSQRRDGRQWDKISAGVASWSPHLKKKGTCLSDLTRFGELQPHRPGCVCEVVLDFAERGRPREFFIFFLGIIMLSGPLCEGLSSPANTQKWEFSVALETIRTIRDGGSPRRPPRSSHSSLDLWTVSFSVALRPQRP